MDRLGLARVDVGATPSVAIIGEGWDVLIAGLDPRSTQAATVRPVRLTPARVLRMAPRGMA